MFIVYFIIYLFNAVNAQLVDLKQQKCIIILMDYNWMASKKQRIACFFFCFIFYIPKFYECPPIFIELSFLIKILEIDMKKRNSLSMESTPFDRSFFSITEKFQRFFSIVSVHKTNYITKYNIHTYIYIYMYIHLIFQKRKKKDICIASR